MIEADARKGMHMLDFFQVPTETYNRLSLRDRVMADLISTMTDSKYYCKAIRIMMDREDLDENDEYTLEVFRNRNEEAIACYCVLRRLYKSEWNDWDKVEQVINDLAERLAIRALVSFGWLKEAA